MKKELVIHSEIESLRLVEKFVDDIAALKVFNDEVYGNILIACIEAANNAICHGNKLDAKKKVHITILINGKTLKITTKDEGNGFDYLNLPDPTAPENIEKISGRGIFLMKKLSDNLEFFEGGRISEVTFNI